jgi:sugar phosphate isomerase/epimerase
MRLGIVADEISRDFREAVAIGKPLGLLRYEVRNLTTGRIPLCSAQEIRAVEETVAREGIEITAVSPGLFKFTEDHTSLARELREVYPRAAELAHRWHLPGLIVFGFHKPGATEAQTWPSENVPAEIIDCLAQAAERASADGLLLIVEPEPICRADTCRTTAAMIDKTGAKNLRINYDPGNVAWLQSRDPIDDFEFAAPYLANVHIKDMRPGPIWLPAGDGIIDYRAHFAALARIGYRGPVSLEPHMDGKVETIRRCREAVERCAAHRYTANTSTCARKDVHS